MKRNWTNWELVIDSFKLWSTYVNAIREYMMRFFSSPIFHESPQKKSNEYTSWLDSRLYRQQQEPVFYPGSQGIQIQRVR